MAIEISSSSEEDIFTNGGVRGHVSMYTRLGKNNSNVVELSDSSDSDDDDMDLVARSELQERNRSGKRRRGKDGEKSGKKDKEKRKKRQRVFADDKGGSGENEEDSDDMGSSNYVYDVDADDEVSVQQVPPAHDEADARIARVLANSRKAMQQVDEEEIIKEAEREAMAATERAESMERARKEAAERQKAAQEQKAKTTAAQSTVQPVILKVRCDKCITKVRTRSNAPLLDMLPKFCEKFGLDHRKAIMQIDGEDVSKLESAKDYDLEDNMVVDVFIR